MKIEFGYNKVAIEVGINKDGDGACKFTKLFKPNIIAENNGYDACLLTFKTADSLQTVIDSLEYLKGVMNE